MRTPLRNTAMSAQRQHRIRVSADSKLFDHGPKV